MIQKFWERIIKELYSFSCFYCAWNFFGRDVMGVLKALKVALDVIIHNKKETLKIPGDDGN